MTNCDQNKNMLIVCGAFDHQRGTPSKIGQIFIEESVLFNNGKKLSLNGGNLQELESLDFAQYGTIIWFPNIDNSEDKILPSIKQKNPHALLVSSKRVVEKEYTEFQVVTRLLKTRSNLGIMITRDLETNRYRFKLLDPLGNQFANTTNINDFCKMLYQRIVFLESLTRVNSQTVSVDDLHRNIDERFIDIVKRFADEFSQHVNAINPGRFLGNASLRSTRCSYGFPAVRSYSDPSRYFVTKRNIDKRELVSNQFVEVTDNEEIVEYFGDSKPSVDAPIQVKLFNYYKKVDYMIHGHVYVKGAPFTDDVIPCGCLEEFEHIQKLFDKNDYNFSVNLRGHGCLMMARDLGYFKTIKLESRGLPEVHNGT